jgi:protein-disulfide isomerase
MIVNRIRTCVGKLALSTALMMVLAIAPEGRTALAAEPLSDAQEQAVERLIRDYIMKHPEVLLESLQAYDAKQRETQEQAAQNAVAGNRDALERDASTPVGGNPKGDVTVVEFFDYRCGYCKKVLPSVQELLKTDGNIRVVFKELPILGPDSVTAARAALAAWKIAPDKYVALHVALMEARGELSEARVLETAKKVGIDPDKLKAAMDDPQIKAQLERNAALAQTLQIAGTPAFIIGGKLVPGAVDLATMREMVKAARAS